MNYNSSDHITEAWMEYQSGIDFNQRINYYYQTERNYRFYKGDQWIGVKSGNLPTPVFNVLKPIFNYYVSAIMSQKVTGQYAMMNVPDEVEDIDPMMMEVDPQLQKEQEQRDLGDFLSKMSELKWENDKMDSMLRDGLLDGCLSGDVCAYVYWDKDKETGQDARGDFCTELVDSCNVMFGNPNTNKVQKQPYILILGRDTVENLKNEAKANGVSKVDIDRITTDEETEYQAGDAGKIELEQKNDKVGKCLYILKFWKEKGKVYWSKSTRQCVIRKAVDMDIRCYPIAWMNWETVKNCYHGQAPASNLISNQIYINKQFAMTMLWLMNSAYGKVVYDSTRISSWSNQLGVAQPVMGDLTGAVQQIQPGQMSNMVLTMIEKTIDYTKDLAGANDGALGNSNPEQASGAAIIAVQKQASIPLETIQQKLWQFVEDIYRIWGEFALRKYTGDRKVSYKEKEKTMVKTFNSTPYKDALMNVKINVGPSSYWSEVASIQTLDGLLNNNRIDIIQYLDRVPNGIIPKKDELVEEIKQTIQMQQQQQQIMAEQQAMAQQQAQQVQVMPEEQMPPQEMQASEMDYEAMAQFMESLSPDTQAQLKSMPDAEMEAVVLEMMQNA